MYACIVVQPYRRCPCMYVYMPCSAALLSMSMHMYVSIYACLVVRPYRRCPSMYCSAALLLMPM